MPRIGKSTKLYILAFLSPLMDIMNLGYLYPLLLDKGFTYFQIGLLDLSISLGATLLLFFGNRLIDLLGKIRTFVFTCVYTAITSLLYPFLDFWKLLVLRFLDSPVDLRWTSLRYIFQDEKISKRGTFFGVIIFFSYLGTALRGYLGGLIANSYGLTGLALSQSLLILLVASYSWFLLGKKEPSRRRKVYAGKVLSKIDFSLVFSNPILKALSVYFFLSMAALSISLVYYTVYGRTIEVSYTNIGLAMSASTLLSLILTPIFGKLSDKFEKGYLKFYIIGILLLTSSFLLLSYSKNFLLYFSSVLLGGLATAITKPTEEALINVNLPKRRRGEIMTILTFFTRIGTMTGIGIAAVTSLFNVSSIFVVAAAIQLLAAITFVLTVRSSV